MSHWELVLAALGFSVAFWNHTKNVVAWFKGFLVVTKKHDNITGLLLLSYLNAMYRRKNSRDGAYGSYRTFVRPLEKVYRVMFQALYGSRQTFFKGWRPIWTGTQSVPCDEAGPAREHFMHFEFIKGTMDWEALLVAAADWEDGINQGSEGRSTRFRVQYHYGTSGWGEMMRNAETASKGSAPLSIDDEVPIAARGRRLLRWSQEDVQGFTLVSSLDTLSLRPELTKIVDELKYWHGSQQWYSKHGVPWRRGVLFHGPPGTGKTSLARALAELLDVPVHVFDLAGMTNQDLQRAWRQMMATAPCMALLEDIDAVFKGRENITPQGPMGGGGLTFNELLNCIDGIERVDGMLLVMTTNYLENVDSALKDRAGRIDRVIEFKPLDHDGRLKMALRILEDAALAEKMATEYHQDTGARFQERCFQTALVRRFNEENAA